VIHHGLDWRLGDQDVNASFNGVEGDLQMLHREQYIYIKGILQELNPDPNRVIRSEYSNPISWLHFINGATV